MLYKNNMRPAFATAGANSSAEADRSKIKDFFTRSEADDDFNSFGDTSERPRASAPRSDRPSQPKRPPQRRRRPQGQIPWKTVAIVAAAVVALALLITLAAVIISSAPQKVIKLKDNTYFSYVDGEGKYHLVSNGDTLKQVFEGELTVVPAKDASFAYVFESVSSEESSGYKMYILEGKKLETVQATADEIPTALADYEPGIIYHQNGKANYYSSDNQGRITGDPDADNFVISGDAKSVVYTVQSSKNEEVLEMRYFSNGGSIKVGPDNFIPAQMSVDGRYIYGVCPIQTDSDMQLGQLGYVEMKDGEEKAKKAITSTNFGEILGITGINVAGDEIIFCAQPLNKETPVSYMYKLNDSEPKQIAEGIFTPVYTDSEVVCPKTFLNSYFVCEKTVVDAEENTKTEISTYFLDKNEGAKKIADAVGKFSPDEKFFYYVNEDNELVSVDLKSKDDKKNSSIVDYDIIDFSIIESGDIYMMQDGGGDDGEGFVRYRDISDEKSINISDSADIDSMKACANSVYFSETDNDDVVTIYVSTEGSAKKEAEFKSSSPTETPVFSMGSDKKGYAYFLDENGNTKLFYTSNGKKFALVSDACSIEGFTQAPETPAPEGDGTES